MLDPFPTTSWIQQEKIRCYKLKAGKLISILRCDDFSSEWNVHRPMTFTVSKAWNYYFILKQQILVEIICPFSLDFCPSTQQVNKWLYGDRLEEIREGERSAKPVIKKKLFPMEHVSFTPKQQTTYIQITQCLPRSRQKIMLGTIYRLWDTAQGPGL